jgi:hypothetical protein
VSDFPPPPPPDGQVARPGIVTAAAWFLLIGGAFDILGGILLLAGAGVAAGRSVGGLFAFLAVIFLATGAIKLYAGTRVLDLKEAGRQLGMFLAIIAAALNLLSLGRTAGSSIIGLAIDVFIVYALATNAQSFRR